MKAREENYLLHAIARLSDEIHEALVLVPEAPSPDQMLTTAELARLLRVSARTLEAWRSDGRGPLSNKIGNAIRYRYSDVLVWISKQQEKTSA